VRRALDLEHRPAFQESFGRMVDMLRDVATGASGVRPPATVKLVGGDVHNAYVAEVSLGKRDPRHSRVHQLVCSPFRNPLSRSERRVVRLTKNPLVAAGLRRLAGLAGVKRASVDLRFRSGPNFENSLGVVELGGRSARVTKGGSWRGDAARRAGAAHLGLPLRPAAAEPGFRLSRGLDRRTQAHQPSPKGDRTDGEPSPAERKPGDHIRHPVQIQQHSARSHRDGEPDGHPGQGCTGLGRPAPTRQQRQGGEERAAVDECPLGTGRCLTTTGRNRSIGRARPTMP
jgi:hypothetical protein